MNRKSFLSKAGAIAASIPALHLPFYSNSEPERILPKALEAGDKIGFVAPAGIVFDESEFEKMKRVMELKGFRVAFAENVRKQWGYFSGTDRERAEGINKMFADPEIKALIAIRGGWGCSRILEMIDFDLIRENPKIYCGFSDNTALQMAILKKTGMITFHGPNGNSEWTEFTRKHFTDVLKNRKPVLMQIPEDERNSTSTIRGGKSAGRLVGGNLTILVSMLGTPYMPDMRGAILFTEDIGEQVYRIDRMLTQLRLSGVLDEISGFVFGKCYDCKESNGPGFTLDEILKQHLEPLGVPVFSGSMISHLENIFTVPQGAEAEIDADKKTIRLLEPAVV